ncbi:hypothetical protein V9T40_007867 [Parthenolecanium corni]|uniref:Probable oligoribonuclease n=1 Tax=Parthenolecanium corni TaxID=536013 RepID=A0AAN9THW5_9HEMI
MAHTPSVDPQGRIVWVDLELTGLDPDKDMILEAACIVTEANLDEVGDRVNFVINQPDDVLVKMGEWCQDMHRKTGLYDEVVRSSLTVQEAEAKLLEHLQKYTAAGKCCLAGNTVYMDRVFLAKYMPKVNEHLHYRIIDVSSIKELCRRWNRDVYLNAPQKCFVHRALEDIIESIAELKYYKQTLFNVNAKLNT